MGFEVFPRGSELDAHRGMRSRERLWRPVWGRQATFSTWLRTGYAGISLAILIKLYVAPTR